MCRKALRLCVLLALCVAVIQSATELDCTVIDCVPIICPLGSSLYKPPTECCQTCRPNLRPTDCTLVVCAIPKCPSGQEPWKPAGECCSVCRPITIKKPGRCPKPSTSLFGIKKCVDTCTSDIDCSALKKCCDTGCGRICSWPIEMKPIKPKGSCLRNGNIYKDGEALPLDKCIPCRCDKGKITCGVLRCIMCVGYTPPGECCPRCGWSRFD